MFIGPFKHVHFRPPGQPAFDFLQGLDVYHRPMVSYASLKTGISERCGDYIGRGEIVALEQ
jgi:hypothetical protein